MHAGQHLIQPETAGNPDACVSDPDNVRRHELLQAAQSVVMSHTTESYALLTLSHKELSQTGRARETGGDEGDMT